MKNYCIHLFGTNNFFMPLISYPMSEQFKDTLFRFSAVRTPELISKEARERYFS